MTRIVGLITLGLFASIASSAPLYPTITGYDFAIGAHNLSIPEYTTAQPGDQLVFDALGEPEVTTFTQNWPNPPVQPVFLGSQFGGDFMLNVRFTGQDAVAGGPSVSLLGTGAGSGGNDLQIFGAIGGSGSPSVLWQLQLTTVVLYGNAGGSSYVMEGLGTITGGTVATQNGLIGQPGALRGHLDFQAPPPGWMPAGYNPGTNQVSYTLRAAFSGETGLSIPEPASFLLAFLGVGALRRR